MYIFHRPLYLRDLTIGLSCLTGLIPMSGIVFSKKILFKENGKIFQGLDFKDYVIFKKQIDTEKIKSIKVYKNSNQQQTSWWTGMLMDMMIADHLYKLKMELKSGEEKYLISFKEQNFYDKAVTFFERNTDLKIENSG